MATALGRLDERAPDRPDDDLRSQSDAGGGSGPSTVRALCLLPHGFDDGPEHGDGGPDEDRGGLRLDVRSHPPTAERIDRLRELAAVLASEAGSVTATTG
jgi:Zn-dependent protease with chaperone function